MSDQIEQHAERLLARVPDWIWDGDSLPVPLEDIVDSVFGLHVREVADLTAAPGVPDLGPAAALSGLLLPAVAEIWVSSQEAEVWPQRRRFTIGHELGHWCLHRQEGPVVYCRSSAVSEEADARPPMEEEANRFAAALLMPGLRVQRNYEYLRRTDPKNCFERLCELFDVSGAAMGRRLHTVI